MGLWMSGNRPRAGRKLGIITVHEWHGDTRVDEGAESCAVMGASFRTSELGGIMENGSDVQAGFR